MPKSSVCGCRKQAAPRYSSRRRSRSTWPRKWTPPPAWRRSRSSSGPWPTMRSSQTELGAGGDRQIDSLVRRQRRDHQAVRAAGAVAGGEEAGVDRRRHYLGLPAVVAADPAGDKARVGDKTVDPAARCHVPGAQPAQRQRAQPRHQAGAVGKVGVLLVPGVAHRGVAIAQVVRPGRRDDAFGNAVAAAHHQVEAAQVVLFDGGGEQRQIAAVVAPQARRVLQRAGADRPPLEIGAERSGKVEQRVDRRLGQQLGEGLEHLLAATHAGQPVVDQRRPGSARGAHPPAPRRSPGRQERILRALS